MENWIPQVREGSKWMREGAASLGEPYQALAALIGVHAGEEQDDFMILFNDYRKAGGAVADIDALRRNPGGEALNAYLHGLAATRDPIGLLGAIYIIEGTGQRIVPALLPLIKAGAEAAARSLPLPRVPRPQRREPPEPLARRGRDGDGARRARAGRRARSSTPRATPRRST